MLQLGWRRKEEQIHHSRRSTRVNERDADRALQTFLGFAMAATQTAARRVGKQVFEGHPPFQRYSVLGTDVSL